MLCEECSTEGIQVVVAAVCFIINTFLLRQLVKKYTKKDEADSK